MTGENFAFAPQPLLAGEKVRYAGEPVALIVAETREAALDAAEAVVVDYAPLPAVDRSGGGPRRRMPLLSPTKRPAICASNGGPATPPRSITRSRRRRMS